MVPLGTSPEGAGEVSGRQNLRVAVAAGDTGRDDRPVVAPSIWLVEDDHAIGSALHRTLVAEGYDPRWATTLAEARAFEGVPDLVILDLNLPDGDGRTLCQELVERHPALRVLMLTARADEMDVVLGLDAGATDYVPKPFRLAELLARVRAQVRAAAAEHGATTVLEVGDLVVDLGARRVHRGEVELSLRPREFDLLARLAAEAGTVVRREVLMSEVWDSHWFGGTKTLDVHIAALRRHVDVPGRPSRITTVRGVGYRLDSSSG
jgi:DNA-binding response OmpR family regulator